jgi:hypothetical protein
MSGVPPGGIVSVTVNLNSVPMISLWIVVPSQSLGPENHLTVSVAWGRVHLQTLSVGLGLGFMPHLLKLEPEAVRILAWRENGLKRVINKRLRTMIVRIVYLRIRKTGSSV